MEEYPDEIRQSPVPLVLVTGETRTAQLRKQLEEHFNANQGSQHSAGEAYKVRVRSVELEETLPKKKERRISYEAYRPQGILKANWFFKHLNVIPSTVVGVFSWDDEGDWRMKELAISGHIDQIKRHIRSRGTKLVIVLVQEKKPQNDPLSEERFASLKKRCDLENKGIVIYATYDSIQSNQRLEKTVVEHVHQYYKDEGRRIKKHREFVGKKLHPALYVRHNIKVAFFAECRQEFEKSLKYFNTAYVFLKDVNESVFSKHEVKSVAELIHFKLCRIYFNTRQSTKAIEQFKKHMKFYKNEIGPQELEFQHWEWISKQYFVFAELLDTRADIGQLTDWYQHPGYFYHAAACAARKRRKIAEKLRLKNEAAQKANSAPKEQEALLFTFVGQTPIRIVEGLEDRKAAVIEQERNSYLESVERKFNHSKRVLMLLARASEQFQKPPKMQKTFLNTCVMMAEEYITQSDYERAKKLCDSVLKGYKKDNWPTIVQTVFKLSLDCALHLRNARDFARFSMDLLSPAYNIRMFEREQIYENFLEIFKPNSPLVAQYPTFIEPMNMDLDSDLPFIQFRGQFEKPTYPINTEAKFVLFVQSFAPGNLSLSSLSVMFNQTISDADSGTPVFDKEVGSAPGLSAKELLMLAPKTPKLLSFSIFVKDCFDLECVAVSVVIGQANSSLTVKVPIQKSMVSLENEYPNQSLPARLRKFKDRNATSVIQPRSRLQIKFKHEPPAIINESYKMEMLLLSKEHHILSGSLTIEDVDIGTPSFAKENIFFLEDGSPLDGAFSIPELVMDKIYKVVVVVKCPHVCQKKIVARATYKTTQEFMELGEESQTLSFEFPFHTKFSFLSPWATPSQENESSENALHLGQASIVQLEAESHVQYPINIVCAEIINAPKDYIQIDNKQGGLAIPHLNEQLPLNELRKGDKFNLCLPLWPMHMVSRMPLGGLRLHWRRSTNTEDENIAIVSLPYASVSKKNLDIDVDIAPIASIGSPLHLRITLKNNSAGIYEMGLNANDSESFIFSGIRSAKFFVVPNGSRTVSFTLIPLTTGHVLLPKIQLISLRQNIEEVSSLKERSIFVYPTHTP